MPPVNGDAVVPSSGGDGSVATAKKRNKPQYHPFTQQQLPACKTILAPHMVIPVPVFVGLIFIPQPQIRSLKWFTGRIQNVYQGTCRKKVAYIQNASIDKTCTRIFKVSRDMKKPIYIYYQLDKFYQNHRRYAKSRSDMQLRDPREADDTQFCKPEATANGSPVVPCGLIAWSLFNDTYSFAHHGDKPLRVIKRGISWESERDHMFGKHVYRKNFQNGSLVGGGQLDPSKPLSEQEDLIVWMWTAVLLPTFRKLYGRIEVDLRAGELIMVRLQNNYNSYSFAGKKTVVLSTAGWLGGRNAFLGRAYVVVGVACFLLELLLTLLCVVFPMKEEHLLLRAVVR